MSDANPPPTPPEAPPPIPPPPASPPAQRDGCLTALMVIVGVVLLLPGLCAIVFGVGNLTSSSPDSVITMLVLLGLAIGAGGVLLIRAAIRGPRP
jgi:hypothetical protein